MQKSMEVTTDERGVITSRRITEADLAPHSMEISQNAKGQYSWVLKMYFRDEEKETAVGEIKNIANQITNAFPNKG